MNKHYILILTMLCLLVTVSVPVMPRYTDAVGQVAEVYNNLEPAVSSTSIAATDDKYIDKQWALTAIDAPEAWKASAGNKEVLIAVLDSGINSSHEDLAGKVVKEVNFSDSPVVTDIFGHGTHIAGIIAATANNKLGIAGLAYNCRLLNVKVANDNGQLTVSALAKGIIWAADNGASVINMSLYSMSSIRELETAVNYAWSKGVVLVAAAGNRKDIGPVYPAHYDNCIAVAATNESNTLAAWSNHGDWVHVAAPGEHIISSVLFGYEYKSGSSMATAYVSGLAAILFAVKQNAGARLTNTAIKAAIENNCTPLPGENNLGQINASLTLQSLALK